MRTGWLSLLLASSSSISMVACTNSEPIEATEGSDTSSGDDTTTTGVTPPASSGELELTDSGSTSTGEDPLDTTTTTTTDDGRDSSSDTGRDPDGDRDGHPASVDCDDTDPEVHPRADERCNGVDDDCDPATLDEGMVSIDGQGSFATIGEAVTAAVPGSELRICPGIYEEHVTIADDLSLVAQQDASVTIIASDAAGPVVTIDAGVVTLVGLTLTGGSSAGLGGGLSVLGTDPVTVEACVLSGNTSSDGAGLYAYIDTQLELVQTTITGNTGEIGGGVAFYGDSLSLTECTVQGNHGSEAGGGLFVGNGATLDLVSTSVIDNTGLDGAGLFIADGVLATLAECTVQRNTATGTGGGARLATGAPVLVSNNSDWGTGADDNAPDDVDVLGVGTWSAYGVGASFQCDALGCS